MVSTIPMYHNQLFIYTQLNDETVQLQIIQFDNSIKQQSFV